jgi:aminoglycoside phosphotransferase family enzyme/predicted kinase
VADTADPQQDIVEFLSRPGTYGPGTRTVERIDTHISVIFLAGDRAYKMKRAVRFEYLDYSDLDRRRRFCEAEIETNRRTAPALYLGVVAVTRDSDGALQLGGDGEPVEWLVEMRRFDQDTLFDRMAEADRLTPELMVSLADAIHRFHDRAEPDMSRGGAAILRYILDGNFREVRKSTPSLFDLAVVDGLEQLSRAALDRVADLLDARSQAGSVRRCHGDLHLRNICLVDGTPTLFDGIEFNDDITVIDVLCDLAFLLMDLEHRQHRDRANEVFNRYMALGGEVEGLAAMPLFLACRAMIRAHTSAAAARTQNDAAARDSLQSDARDYLDLAASFLEPGEVRLVAVGGLSGTGKSTLARALAPGLGRAPGALVLRSDVIRKRLFGVAPEDPLGPEGYANGVSAKVYATIQDRAAAALAAGHSVIADAVFAREGERNALEGIARAAGVTMTGLWLEAPERVMADRVTARSGDASDADAAVVRSQLGYDTGLIRWHRIDAARGANTTLAAAKAILSRP